MRGLVYHRHCYRHPSAETPSWSRSVERWYQQDAFAFGLADAASRLAGKSPRPDLLLLASPGASNESDARFVLGGLTSPSRFAHTLPNARASALCQVLGWSGPVICVQKDPATVVAALGEATVLGNFPTVWVMGARSLDGERYEAYLFETFLRRAHPSWETLPYRLEPCGLEGEPDPLAATDESLFGWLDDESRKEGASFRLGSGFALARTVYYG